MLESKISTKLDKTGNVLLLGDPFSGKKRIIKSIQEHSRPSHLENKRETEPVNSLDTDKVYIMDFKYINAKQQLQNEEYEEIGKINFFIFNKRYDFVRDFLTRDMLQNLVVMIVVDFEYPEIAEDSITQWLDFIQKDILSYIGELGEDVQMEIKSNYADLLVKMKNFGNTALAAVRKNQTFALKEVIKEEAIQEEKYEENEKNEQENGEYYEQAEVEKEVDNSNFIVPLIIFGSKSDTADSDANDSVKDYLEYTLRRLNIENESVLFSGSAKNDWNMSLLAKFLMYVFLDKYPESTFDLRENTSVNKLFVRAENDSIDKLKESFPSVNIPLAKNRVENIKKEEFVEETEVKSIQEFLSDLGAGNFQTPAEVEENMYKSQNFSSTYVSTNSKIATEGKVGTSSTPTDLFLIFL